MAPRKSPQKHAPHRPQTAHPRGTREPPPTVSGKWLLGAVAVTIPAAAFCGWAVLCLLFWQGSWQLLYHPATTIARTPASIGLAFDPISFAVADTGETQLQGWWIPAGAGSRPYTVLYLHDRNGNLGDTLDDLASLHTAGVSVLAFDYRGFGQSLFAHPSEARWRQDAEWALQYLSATRHVDEHAIVITGNGLGANLALEVAAAHPGLAGVVVEAPLDAPMNAIFDDPRAHLVPAHLLVRDRFSMTAPAAALRIPSLWVLLNSPAGQAGTELAFQRVAAAKMRVSLPTSSDGRKDFVNALTRWLDDLTR